FVRDIGDAAFRQALHCNSRARDPINHDVLEMAISEGGRALGGLRWRPAIVIVHLEVEPPVPEMLRCDVLDDHVFYCSAPPPPGFEVEPPVNPNKVAVLDEDVAHTTRHFAAQGEASAELEDAIGDPDVTGWPPDEPPLDISAGFDGYVIVMRA